MQHKAWQARFHAAMSVLRPWRARVLLRVTADDPGPLRAWCCRALSVQHHEQSAWVRFSLPPALAVGGDVEAACQQGRLVSR